MEYIIYCDESRHDTNGGHKCLSIGGLWVEKNERDRLTQELKRLRAEVGLAGEMKWSKVSLSRLEAYRRIVDFFFDSPVLKFRCIVVEHAELNDAKFHGGDKELGFYKFYYEMLEKWMLQNDRYLVLLDFKKNKGSDRYGTLRRVLETKVKGRAWIDDLTVIDSRQSQLAQVADLLTGAVAADWCGMDRSRPKGQLAEYIGKRRGSSLATADELPSFNKFNIFKIRLQ